MQWFSYPNPIHIQINFSSHIQIQSETGGKRLVGLDIFPIQSNANLWYLWLLQLLRFYERDLKIHLSIPVHGELKVSHIAYATATTTGRLLRSTTASTRSRWRKSAGPWPHHRSKIMVQVLRRRKLLYVHVVQRSCTPSETPAVQTLRKLSTCSSDGAWTIS